MKMNLIKKRKDHEVFSIPCTIGMLQFSKHSYDMAARINLTPYAIYKKLGLGEIKSTTMRVLMDDRSIKHLLWIVYDILVNFNRLIFLDNFVILDCEIDAEIPIFLGRPW